MGRLRQEDSANCLDLSKARAGAAKKATCASPCSTLPPYCPPDQALLAQPPDFLARLSRVQPERGQFTLLAGALILPRWAGGLHQGPSCPDLGPVDHMWL